MQPHLVCCSQIRLSKSLEMHLNYNYLTLARNERMSMNIRPKAIWSLGVVVAHEAVGVAEPVEALDGLAEDGEEDLAVTVVSEDTSPRVTAGGDVVDRAGEFYA